MIVVVVDGQKERKNWQLRQVTWLPTCFQWICTNHPEKNQREQRQRHTIRSAKTFKEEIQMDKTDIENEKKHENH